MTRALAKREPDRTVPPVENSWKRLEAWFEQNLPITYQSLGKAAPAARVKRFEKSIGQALPREFRDSLLVHDGQQGLLNIGDGEFEYGIPGVIFGNVLMALEKNALDRNILDVWKFRSGWSYDPTKFDEKCTSHPEGAIRLRDHCLLWIPLYDDGAGNHWGLDLDPGPNGVVGQVINFGRDQYEKFVLARSWGQFLEDVADELEAGNYQIEKKGQILRMRTPRWFGGSYREWSKAKVR